MTTETITRRGRPAKKIAAPVAAKVTADDRVTTYLNGTLTTPLLLAGDAQQVLATLPDASVDCIVTSPPYWGLREYEAGGIGMEAQRDDYITALLAVFREAYRVLKPSGSFWLNLGDTYEGKGMSGIPWRVAIRLMDDQGWIMRSEVIWSKSKGPSNSRDRFRNTHEQFFHFTKEKRYHFDAAAVAAAPRQAKIENGRVVSATGVTGQSYKRKIELSTSLTEAQKKAAFEALAAVLLDVQTGKLHDFRMVIKGAGRVTNGDTAKVSGRAKQLEDQGFYFLKYHPDGTLPGDVWDITPEDTQGRELHFAPFPEDLVRQPILATCPPGGVVLDPFSGTGTTCAVAWQLERRSIGVDISEAYLEASRERWEGRLM